MSQLVSSAVERVLTTKPILMSHPGASALSDYYASASNASSHLVEAVNRNGAVRVATNNLQLGATSSFSLSTSLLFSNPVLNVELTLPANHYVNDGWAFLAVNNVEISFANSLAQNLIQSGSSMRDVLLYCTPDPQKRALLLQQAGSQSTVAGTIRASIPLGSIVNRGLLSNSYPLDGSTLQGFMQFSVTWNDARRFMMVNSTNPAAAFPTAFTKCELVFSTAAINDAGFAIKNALMSNPLSTYVIPSHYFAPYTYHQNITLNSGNLVEFVTTACPKGILNGILLSIQPTSEIAGAANGRTLLYPNGVPLNSLRVQYNGVDIYRADTPKEIQAYNRFHHNGDDLSFRYKAIRSDRNVANRDLFTGNIYYIPFNYDSSLVRSSHHFENMPSYDGATLSFSFIPDPTGRTVVEEATLLEDQTQLTTGGGAAEDYTIEVVFDLNTLVEINESGTDLQR